MKEYTITLNEDDVRKIIGALVDEIGEFCCSEDDRIEYEKVIDKIEKQIKNNPN